MSPFDSFSSAVAQLYFHLSFDLVIGQSVEDFNIGDYMTKSKFVTAATRDARSVSPKECCSIVELVGL